MEIIPQETREKIFEHILLYKDRFTQVNWVTYRMLSISELVTWDMITKYPIPWCWPLIPKNPNITFKIISDHPDKNWYWMFVSLNPNITWEVVESHPELPWDFNQMTENPNITWEIIKNNPDRDWDWNYLLRTPYITLEHIFGNTGIKWNYLEVSKYFSLSYQQILFVNDQISKQYNFEKLILWQNLSLKTEWEIIKDNPDLPWNWDFVSQNSNITWEIVLSNRDQKWNYLELLLKIPITDDLFEAIENRSIVCDKYWDLISSNKSLTWKIIKKYDYHNWCWVKISKHPNITWGIIKNNPEMPWRWDLVSQNPNITYDIVVSHPEYPWSSINMVHNSNLYCEFLLRDMYPDDLKLVSDYRIVDESIKKYILKVKQKREAAAIRIQRQFRKSRLNPSYKLCKEILNHDCEKYLAN
jgi:hypothetical protein